MIDRPVLINSSMFARSTVSDSPSARLSVMLVAVSDVIMPEIASKADEPPKVALVLWQRASGVYCVVMMPMAVLFFYYADVFISLLFTDSYAAAISMFQIFVLLLGRSFAD